MLLDTLNELIDMCVSIYTSVSAPIHVYVSVGSVSKCDKVKFK